MIKIKEDAFSSIFFHVSAFPPSKLLEWKLCYSILNRTKEGEEEEEEEEENSLNVRLESLSWL